MTTDMKKLFLISYFLFLISYLSYGQINRVINPSFELDTCIESWTGWGEIFQYVQGWDTIRNGTAGLGGPDIFNECYVPSSPFGSYDVPVNFAGIQYPKSGTGYAALIVIATHSSGDLRDFVQGTLIQTLINGNNYCVKMYINLSNFSKKSCLSFGAYLDDGQITVNKFEMPNVIPQVVNIGQQLDDTLNWMKIEDSFIANGTEEYITIGNFLSNDSSNVIESYPLSSYPGSYYYIDDVSVIDISTPAYAGVDITIAIGDSVFIGRQPEIGLNDDCVWYVNGNAIDTVAGLWVMPDSTTTYILEQTICGYTTYDTVTVTVLPTNIEAPKSPKGTFSIYPNPSSTSFTVSLTDKSISELNIVIKDVMGKIVYVRNNLTLSESKTEVDFDVQSGVYFVTVNHGNTNKSVTKKLIVNR